LVRRDQGRAQGSARVVPLIGRWEQSIHWCNNNFGGRAARVGGAPMLAGCAAALRASQRSLTSASTAVPISTLVGCRSSWQEGMNAPREPETARQVSAGRSACAVPRCWRRHAGRLSLSPPRGAPRFRRLQEPRQRSWLRCGVDKSQRLFAGFGGNVQCLLCSPRAGPGLTPLSLTPPRSGPPLAITTFDYWPGVPFRPTRRGPEREHRPGACCMSLSNGPEILYVGHVFLIREYATYHRRAERNTDSSK
jgi:hypothetical protein